MVRELYHQEGKPQRREETYHIISIVTCQHQNINGSGVVGDTYTSTGHILLVVVGTHQRQSSTQKVKAEDRHIAVESPLHFALRKTTHDVRTHYHDNHLQDNRPQPLRTTHHTVTARPRQLNSTTDIRTLYKYTESTVPYYTT